MFWLSDRRPDARQKAKRRTAACLKQNNIRKTVESYFHLINFTEYCILWLRTHGPPDMCGRTRTYMYTYTVVQTTAAHVSTPLSCTLILFLFRILCANLILHNYNFLWRNADATTARFMQGANHRVPSLWGNLRNMVSRIRNSCNSDHFCFLLLLMSLSWMHVLKQWVSDEFYAA